MSIELVTILLFGSMILFLAPGTTRDFRPRGYRGNIYHLRVGPIGFACCSAGHLRQDDQFYPGCHSPLYLYGQCVGKARDD